MVLGYKLIPREGYKTKAISNCYKMTWKKQHSFHKDQWCIMYSERTNSYILSFIGFVSRQQQDWNLIYLCCSETQASGSCMLLTLLQRNMAVSPKAPLEKKMNLIWAQS